MDNFNISAWFKKQYLLETKQNSLSENIKASDIDSIDFTYTPRMKRLKRMNVYLKNDEKTRLENKNDIINWLKRNFDIEITPRELDNAGEIDKKVIPMLKNKGVKQVSYSDF